LSVARFGNAAVEPREGYELDLEGYERLFAGMPHVFLDEPALLASYLAGRGPNLVPHQQSSGLQAQKWLSVVASSRADVFQPGTPFAALPHAAGRLRLN